MDATVIVHIKNMEDFNEVHRKEDFEYDLRESTYSLLQLMGVDFEDVDFQFGYMNDFEHEE